MYSYVCYASYVWFTKYTTSLTRYYRVRVIEIIIERLWERSRIVAKSRESKRKGKGKERAKEEKNNRR